MNNVDFLTDISNILDNSVKETPHVSELREDKNNPPTIVKLKSQGRMVVCSLDRNGLNPFPYFNSQIHGLCSVNDYIIFSQDTRDTPFVLIIELKENCDPRHQLWAGKQICDFMIKRLNSISTRKYEPKIRMIGVCKMRKLKRPVRVNNIKYDENNMVILNSDIMNLCDFLK